MQKGGIPKWRKRMCGDPISLNILFAYHEKFMQKATVFIKESSLDLKDLHHLLAASQTCTAY